MRYFGLSVGLEQEQTVAEQNEDKVAEVLDVDGVDNLETELLEVADSDAEGAAREEAIDEASEVIDSMEDDVEDLKTAQESGGIDQFAASILVRGVNHRLASIGMSPVMLPAQESFGSVSDRQAATSIAIEAISDKVREAWKAIINAIKRAAKWIKGHFVKVFGGFERLKKRASAVNEKAEKATGTAKEKNFENDSLYNKLKVNKNVTNNVSHFENTFDIIEKVMKGMASSQTSVDKLVSEVENIENDGSNNTTVTVNAITESMTGSVAKETVKANENKANDSNSFQSSEMLGGTIVLVHKGKDNDARPAQYRINLAQNNPKESRSEGRRLTILSLNDAAALADRIESIADLGINNRKVMDDLATAKEKLATAVERLSKREAVLDDEGNTDVEATSQQRNKDRGIRADIMAIDRMVGNFPAKFTGYALNAMKSVLDYCELSIRQYSDK